jgi:hypothetical protein
MKKAATQILSSRFSVSALQDCLFRLERHRVCRRNIFPIQFIYCCVDISEHRFLDKRQKQIPAATLPLAFWAAADHIY